VGGPEKVQNVADVIFGWSLSEIQFIIKNPLLAERAVQLKKNLVEQRQATAISLSVFGI
jgi:hypothetical protein